MKDNLQNIPELNLDKTEHFYVVGTKNRDGVLAGNYKVDIKKGSGSSDDTSVLRTTAQTLTYEQQEMALSNLGVYPPMKVPAEHQIRCDWNFDCETHCFDSDTLNAIKSIPDGDSFDDPTYKYLTYSDDNIQCIITYKYTGGGYIEIELHPYILDINYISKFEGLYIYYYIDESTGEVRTFNVREGDGEEWPNNLSVLKSSIIKMFTNRGSSLVTHIDVQYKGFLCPCLQAAMLLTLLQSPAISFTGKIENYSVDSWQDFVFTVGSSNGYWSGFAGGSVAASEGKLFAGGIG